MTSGEGRHDRTIEVRVSDGRVEADASQTPTSLQRGS